MRFSEASGHKVVSTSSAETVGKVHGFVIDPQRRAVVAVQCRKADGDVLAWPDIVGFGADAVTVADAGAIKDAASPEVEALRGKDHHVLGKRVLSSTGDELGKVQDVAFDPATGIVETLFVEGAEIAGDRLIGVGSYAVVVSAA